MGLLIAIARKVQLNSQRFMFEAKLTQISSAMTDLSAKIADYDMLQNDFEPNSAEAKAFQEKIQEIMNSELSLQEQEKAMDEIFSVLQRYSDIILPTEE